MYLAHKNWRFGLSWPKKHWFDWGVVISGGGWIDDVQIWRVGPFYAVKEWWPEIIMKDQKSK